MKLPRILLADDHPLVAEGIKSVLGRDAELVGSVQNGADLLAAAKVLRPDVIVLDISMPVLNGVEAARQLRRIVPDAKIVFLTMYGDPGYVSEAFKLGASGYLLKHSPLSELRAAIREVLNGRLYVTPLLASSPLTPVSTEGSGEAGEDLTDRQRQVLRLIANGRSEKEIAFALHISVRTAEFHKSNIMRKLGLRTVAELTKYAVRNGLTEV